MTSQLAYAPVAQQTDSKAQSTPPSKPPTTTRAKPALRPLFQRKLAVSTPGDQFEREADATADQVITHTPAQPVRRCACGGIINASGECDKCHRRRLGLQRSATNGAALGSVPPSVQQVVRGSGEPLQVPIRSFMEARFRRDFSDVQVHTNREAQQSSNEVNAQAYTVGNHIVFGRGQFNPNTQHGQHLIAHELTHVLQQSEGETPLIQRQAGDATNMSITAEYAQSLNDSDLLDQAKRVQDQVDTLPKEAAEREVAVNNLSLLQAEQTRRLSMESGMIPMAKLGGEIPRPAGLPLDQGYMLQPVPNLPSDVINALPEGEVVDLTPELMAQIGAANQPTEAAALQPADFGNPMVGTGTSMWLNASSTLSTYGLKAAGDNAIGIVSLPRWFTPGARFNFAGDPWGHTAVYTRIDGKIAVVRGYTVADELGLVFDPKLAKAVETGKAGVPAAYSNDARMLRHSGARTLEYPVPREVAEGFTGKLPAPGETGTKYTAVPEKGLCVGDNCISWASKQLEKPLGAPVTKSSGQGPLYRTLGEIEAGKTPAPPMPGATGEAVASSMPRGVKLLRTGGRVLLVVGIAVDAYEVYSAPPEQRARTTVGVAGGFVAGLGAGAAAGLACGPGAPVCSVVLGLGFGIAFSWLGRKAAEGAYDLATEKPKEDKPVYNSECPSCHTRINQPRDPFSTAETSKFLWGDSMSSDYMKRNIWNIPDNAPLKQPQTRQLSEEDMAVIRQWLEKTPEAK